jgi:macrolide-specific efflux system membrane fusion protein
MLQPSNPKPARIPAWRRLLHGLARRRWLIILIGLLALGSYALYEWLQPARSVLTFTVARGDISASVSANARVRSTRSAHLSFPVSGQLTQVLVQEGDAVKSGDLLAELKPDDFDRRVKQAELALVSRQLDLGRAQAPPSAQDLQIAQSNLKKAALALAVAQDNAKKNPSSANDAAQEAAQADYDSSRASFDRLTQGPTDLELQQLKNSIASAQLDLDGARAAQAQTQLIAPYDAIVTEVDVQVGELAGGFTPVIGIADLSRLELFADIDEIDVGAVAPGQSVDIRFDAFPGETLSGKLTTLFPAASNVRGALVYNARISFNAGKLAIRPGMGATIKIATVDKKNVLLVPSRAIRNAGSQKIVTASVNGLQENVVVETGVSDGNNTEIVAGIEEGEQVVIQ